MIMIMIIIIIIIIIVIVIIIMIIICATMYTRISCLITGELGRRADAKRG